MTFIKSSHYSKDLVSETARSLPPGVLLARLSEMMSLMSISRSPCMNVVGRRIFDCCLLAPSITVPVLESTDSIP